MISSATATATKFTCSSTGMRCASLALMNSSPISDVRMQRVRTEGLLFISVELLPDMPADGQVDSVVLAIALHALLTSCFRHVLRPARIDHT